MTRRSRALRLLRGPEGASPLRRLRTALGLARRIGPRELTRVLWRSVSGPPQPRGRDRPHPSADAPPTPLPSVSGEDVVASVLLVEDRPRGAVHQSIQSLHAQSVSGWEVCRVDPARGFAGWNEALSRAKGEWVVSLRAGDRLGPHALAWLLHTAAHRAEVDVAYADEDVFGSRGRHTPQFKPGWSPDLLLARNYLGGPLFARRSRLVEAGGWDADLGAGAEHDLALRLTEGARQVVRIPRILLHRRAPLPVGSTRSKPAVEAALARRGVSARVVLGPAGCEVRRTLTTEPRVAIIIPTRDRRDLLEACLRSHRERTTHRRCEVLVVDNGSGPAARRWLEGLRDRGEIALLRRPGPFDFSALTNAGAAATDAEVLCFLNNDTEVLAPGWIEAMLVHALRPDVGAVGARLLGPDGSIQHAGVVLGIGPDRVAADAFQGEPPGSGGYMGLVSSTREVSAVSAACLMVRRDAFESVGGFDSEELRVSFGDVDLCLRLAAKGMRTLYVPEACLRHLGSASRPGATDPAEVEAMRRRYGTRLLDDPYYSPHLSRDHLDGLWD